MLNKKIFNKVTILIIISFVLLLFLIIGVKKYNKTVKNPLFWDYSSNYPKPVDSKPLSIEINVHTLKFIEPKIISQYKVFSDEIKYEEIKDDVLLIDQFGLSCISLNNKKLLWSNPMYRIFDYGGGIADDSVICAKKYPTKEQGVYNERICCADIRTGKVNWIFPDENTDPFSVRIVFFDESKVVINFSNAFFNVLDTKTGKKLWKKNYKSSD